MKDRSIKTRLRLLITSACIVAILLSSAALVGYQIYRYKRDTSTALTLRARILALNASAALAFQNVSDAQELLSVFQLDPAVTSACIFDQNGNRFAEYHQTGRPAEQIAPTQDRTPHYDFSEERITIWSPIEQQGKLLGVFAFSRNLNELHERVRESTLIALLVALVTGVFAFWLSHVLQGSVSAPLLQLASVAKQVTEKKDFHVSAHISGGAEIDVLGQAFNEMLSALNERDQLIRRHAQDLETKVTERTSQLEQTNKDLQMFGYSVSHDLRTPLRSILGFSEALQEVEGERMSAEGDGYLKRIRRNAERMNTLIDGLLTFARLGHQSVTKVSVDMASLAREVLEDLSFQQKSRHITFEADTLPPALGDPSLLRQVWANLLGNAFKFTMQCADPVIRIGSKISTEGRTIYFVSDNGIGFDMEHSTRLFTLFERLHSNASFEGTGIGLAAVHRILQRHGGKIWAEAKVGCGATFYFQV
ncbi:MAG TPA: ATP-binding protein [Opitutaceae bacterium]